MLRCFRAFWFIQNGENVHLSLDDAYNDIYALLDDTQFVGVLGGLLWE